VLRDEIFPAVIGANDLGTDLLEVGPGLVDLGGIRRNR
jgi:hypothetical protein